VSVIRSILLFFVFLLGACAPQQSLLVRVPYQHDILLVTHRFLPLEEGRLYSGSEPSDAMIAWLTKEKGVKTFVSLKGDMDPRRRAQLASEGVAVHAFAWSAHRVPPEEETQRVFHLMQGSTERDAVYVYCKAGVDRTGYARAYYRYFGQGWSARDSLNEMYSMFHFPNVLDDDLKKKFSESKNPQ
jgi:protein tyrosine/serine phosphatase